VTEVQRAPQVRLVGIAPDQLGLDGGGAEDELLEQRVVARDEQRVGVVLDEGEVLRRGDDRLLDRLGEAGPHVAVARGAQEADVRDHRDRLVEGPEQVLGQRVVDRDLAAEGAVDLREQRRRDVDVGDAAHVAAGHPSTEVGDDAAAEGEHHVAPREVRAGQPVPERDRLVEALAPLARGNAAHERVDPRALQPAHKRGAVELAHRLVRDDRDRDAVEHRAEALEQRPDAGHHVHLVAVAALRDGGHRGARVGERDRVTDAEGLDGGTGGHGLAS
jgi:hypothetical protein